MLWPRRRRRAYTERTRTDGARPRAWPTRVTAAAGGRRRPRAAARAGPGGRVPPAVAGRSFFSSGRIKRSQLATFCQWKKPRKRNVFGVQHIIRKKILEVSKPPKSILEKQFIRVSIVKTNGNPKVRNKTKQFKLNRLNRWKSTLCLVIINVLAHKNDLI